MGFYIRKSLRAGPFRFNLSKSGLGVSVGVPGFRVGTGPRGNYVHVGRGGVYYRATLGGSRNAGRQPAVRQPAPWTPPVNGDVPLEDMTGASVADLLPTESGDLVNQLNAAAKRIAISPLAAVAFAIFGVLSPPWTAVAAAAIGLPAVAWLWARDRARRSVVAFYNVEDRPAQWFTDLVAKAESLGRVGALWRINASGHVRSTYECKVNSGASNIVSRTAVAVTLRGPRTLVTNIAVPTILAGRHALHFLPDRLLVRDGRSFAEVDYSRLNVHAAPQRFIESGRLARDAEQVDVTWQYVNVRGGPDRRFKDNRQLPVMLYGELELATASGLLWILQSSRVAAAEEMAGTLRVAPSLVAA